MADTWTIDKLIAWADQMHANALDAKRVREMRASRGVEPDEYEALLGADLLIDRYDAHRAALRELRQLREGVARVRDLHKWSGTVTDGQIRVTGDDWVSLASVLRALTPEGTT